VVKRDEDEDEDEEDEDEEDEDEEDEECAIVGGKNLCSDFSARRPALSLSASWPSSIICL
jgi:hypothetical protein